MSDLVNVWNKSRKEYITRYYNTFLEYKRTNDKQVLGHLLECSYVLIGIFGLKPKEIDDIEKFGFLD